MSKYLSLCIGGNEINEIHEIRSAHPNLPGVSPEFAARLSAEDLADIEAGDISVELVRAFEQAAIAREAGFHSQTQRFAVNK